MICDSVQTCIDQRGNSACDRKAECISSSDRRSKIACCEKNKTYMIENCGNHEVSLYHVDGGVVKEGKETPRGTAKCDYMVYFYDQEKPTLILIELKGCNNQHALEQISNTMTLFKDMIEQKCSRVYARIVNSKSIPNIQAGSPVFLDLNRKIKRMNGNIILKERRLDEKYSTL